MNFNKANEVGKKWSQPLLLVSANCKLDTVSLKISDMNLSMNKSDFGILVILIDFIVVLIYIWFIFFLDRKQNEYSTVFKDQTIEMNDYTIEFRNIPNDSFFQGKEQILRAILWDKLEAVMND